MNAEETRTLAVPVVFAFVEDKRLETYIKVMERVQERIDYCPKVLCMDLEQGLLKAAQKVFDKSRISLCSIHFMRCVKRKLQAINTTQMQKDSA